MNHSKTNSIVHTSIIVLAVYFSTAWCIAFVFVVLVEGESCKSKLASFRLKQGGVAAMPGHASLPQSSSLGERLIALEEQQPSLHSISLHLPFREHSLCYSI